MAVTLTVEQLRDAIRAGDSAEETATVTRLLATATAMVVKFAPDADNAIHAEAVVRIAGYLFDAPSAASGSMYANVGRNSGAWAILLPYRTHRSGSTAEATP